MSDFVVVAIADSRNHLLKAEASFDLSKLASLDNVVEELTAANEFHYKKDVCLSFDDFIEFDDMWMPKTTQVVNLSPYFGVHIRFLRQFILIDDLNRYRDSSRQVITL